MKLPKITKVIIILFHCITNLLSQRGYIKTNPRTRFSSLKFCNCYLNSLTAHDSINILLFQVYITKHNYDIICLLETFLNSSIQSNDNRIKIDGYNLIRSGHPSHSKKGGVRIWYKEHISVLNLVICAPWTIV